MKCIWVKIGEGFICSHCGWQSSVVIDKECNPLETSGPPLPELRCVHRGSYIGESKCISCVGNVRIKVFACVVFGECTAVMPDIVKGCCNKCQSKVLVQ